MRSQNLLAKAMIKDTDIPLCQILPGVSLVVVHPQTIRDPKQKVVEEAEERGNKNPELSGTLGYSTIKEILLSENAVEVIPSVQQEPWNGALIAEKK